MKKFLKRYLSVYEIVLLLASTFWIDDLICKIDFLDGIFFGILRYVIWLLNWGSFFAYKFYKDKI